MSRSPRAMPAILAALSAASCAVVVVPDHASGAGGRPGDGSDAGSGSGGGLSAATTAICPASDARSVGTNTAIVVHSDTPFDVSTVTQQSVLVRSWLGAVSGTVTVSASDLVFLPTDPLPAGQTVEVSLAPSLRDGLGRSLALATSRWRFTTSSGPTPTGELVFSAPAVPPEGAPGATHALAMDGERAILAWSTVSSVWITATDDGASFVPPVDLAGPQGAVGQQLGLGVGHGAIDVAWTQDGDLYFGRIDAELSGPPAPTQLLSAIPDGAAIAPMTTAGPGGEVAVAWLLSKVAAVHEVVVATSANGATFSAPVTLQKGPTSCADVLWIDGHLVVAWTAGNLGYDTLRVAISDDGGTTFRSPVLLATTKAQFWCPRLVDDRAGNALVLFDEGPGIGKRHTNLGRCTVANGLAEPPVALTEPDEVHQCSALASTPSGRLVLSHSRGHAFESDWVTTLRTSEDGGRTFGPPTIVDVFGPTAGCPDVGYASSGTVNLAWANSDYELTFSRGVPKRPCQ